jgi:SAM-dependent methyltransferase
MNAEDVPPTVNSPAAPKLPISHYDADYFKWQNAEDALGAELNKTKFLPYLGPSHRRGLDFGCGSGALLAALPFAERVGVEINPVAVASAQQREGIEIHTDIGSVPSESIDAVVSNHAIEHVEWPLGTMRELARVLKPDGIAIIVVPCDRANLPFSPNDKDFHLYSWSAGNLGNMARAASFEVLEVSELIHRWPPKKRLLRKLLGPQLFDIVCRLYGAVRRDRTQVRLVARKVTS